MSAAAHEHRIADALRGRGRPDACPAWRQDGHPEPGGPQAAALAHHLRHGLMPPMPGFEQAAWAAVEAVAAGDRERLIALPTGGHGPAGQLVDGLRLHHFLSAADDDLDDLLGLMTEDDTW